MSKFENLFTIEEKIEYLNTLMKNITDENKEKELKKLKKYSLNLLSTIIFSMRTNQLFNYFAVFIDNLDIEFNTELNAPAATYFKRNYFVIVYNPFILFQYDKEIIREILVHEVYHIIFKHSIYLKKFYKELNYSKEVLNIAADIEINQYLTILSEDERFINFNFLEKLGIPKHTVLREKDFDYYLNLLKGKVNNIEIPVDEVEYMLSEDSDTIEELKESITNNLILDSSNKTTGDVPNEINKIVELLQKKSQIKWKNVLKQYIGQIPVPYKYARNRLNRRQPERIDLYGTIQNSFVNIICAFDVSGSISDEEYEICLNEVFNICKAQRKKFNITVIQCDCSIKEVFNVKSKNDFRKINRRGNGGTKFSPVIKYLNEKHLKHDSILVYFTDGKGEKELTEKPLGYKIIWVVFEGANELNLIEPYGRVLEIDRKELKNKK